MKVLVLGGSKFVGHHIVETLLAHGHEVATFSRGQTNPGSHPGVTELRGDRLGDVSALEGGNWDAVVDTSAYVPRAVRSVAEILAPSNPYYLFISTISVYDDPQPGADEDAKVLELADPTVETIDAATYGGLKVLCERELLARFPRLAIVRPGLLMGPQDPTDRFTFWVWRFGRGGEVPIPNVPGQPLQILDARDLATFVVSLVEAGTLGVFNAAGRPTTFGNAVRAMGEIGGASPRWIDAARFEAAGIEPWRHLPLVPSFDGSGTGLLQISSARANAVGLSPRPLEDSIRDTFAWCRSRDGMAVGMTAEQEAAVIALDSGA